ncbi:importin beta [Ordospora colligata]|nr:importin beta [Ordospora colligata]
MDRRELEACLYDVLRSDAQTGKQSEARILDLQANDFGRFVPVLAEVFCDVNTNDQVKMVAGIIFKNTVHANDVELQRMCLNRWLSLDGGVREYIKGMLKEALEGYVPRFCVMTGAILGYIARIEVENGIDPRFFEEMRMKVNEDDKIEGVCEAVGVSTSYIAKEAPGVFEERIVRMVFETCIYALINGTNSRRKLAGLKCLMNSMEAPRMFCRAEDMRVFLDATMGIWNGSDDELIHKSMICFNRMVMLYYNYTEKGMLEDMLSQYLGRFFKSNSDEIKVQAIEYWCIFAEKKDDWIIDKYLPVVLPEILRLLSKGEEYNADGWTSHKAASSCLEMYTEIKGNKLMKSEVVWGFIESSLRSSVRLDVDIGAIALGSIMCEECEDYLVMVMPQLVGGVNFEESKESCLWALSKAAECNFYALVEYLPAIISKCGGIVLEGSKPSMGAAWVMNCVFDSVYKLRKNETYAKHLPKDIKRNADGFVEIFLVKQYLDVVNMLVKGTEMVSLNDSGLRIALFSALNSLISVCPPMLQSILSGFYEYTARKIDECVGVLGHATQDQILVVEDVLSNYIGLIEAITMSRKTDGVEDVMGVFLKILESTPTIAFGEVYISVSNLSTKFVPHVSILLPYIIRDMKCTDKFVLNSVINLVGRLASTMGTDFSIIASVIMPLLGQCLGSESTPKELKPVILSVFGDIALALEKGFEPHVEMVAMLFSQIAELDFRYDKDYVEELRKNSLQLVNCSLVAVGDCMKVRSAVPRILSIAHVINASDENGRVHEQMLGLIDDLVMMYGKNFGLDDPWIKEFLHNVMKHGNDKNRNRAGHILEVLR